MLRSLFVCLLASFLVAPVSTAQQVQPSTNASDPQAVAAVQAAITKMGGATAISQSHSWTFQAQMQGPIDNGIVTTTLDLQSTTLPVTVNGKTVMPRFIVTSPFIPALLASLLLNSSQDPTTRLIYEGAVPLGSLSATAVSLSIGNNPIIAQRWLFDSTTGLPARVEIKFPLQIGRFRSFVGTVDFSDYQTVSGVLFPFQIVEHIDRRPFAQTITLQSVMPNANTTPTQPSPAGAQ